MDVDADAVPVLSPQLTTQHARGEDRRYLAAGFGLVTFSVCFMSDLDTWRNESQRVPETFRERMVGGRDKFIGISSKSPCVKDVVPTKQR